MWPVWGSMLTSAADGSPGDERSLGQREVAGPLVEEDARGRLDADRRLPADRAVRDVVEVLIEDPALAVDAGVALLELLGELGLLDLARDRPRAIGVVEV